MEESGGTAWSAEPGAPLPGSDDAGVLITITVPGGDEAELARRFERVAAGVVPAHLPTRLSVSSDEGEVPEALKGLLDAERDRMWR